MNEEELIKELLEELPNKNHPMHATEMECRNKEHCFGFKRYTVTAIRSEDDNYVKYRVEVSLRK